MVPLLMMNGRFIMLLRISNNQKKSSNFLSNVLPKFMKLGLLMPLLIYLIISLNVVQFQSIKRYRVHLKGRLLKIRVKVRNSGSFTCNYFSLGKELMPKKYLVFAYTLFFCHFDICIRGKLLFHFLDYFIFYSENRNKNGCI